MTVHEFFLPASWPLRLGVGAYSVFVVWASLRPAGTGGAIPHLDKVLHLVVYALLGVGLALAWPKLSKFRLFWGCVFFGVAMELAQGMMGSGRTASFWDGVANSLGAAIGLYAVFLLSRLFAKPQK